MNIGSATQIICFGETLWDVFPDGKQPGGAPLNVAYHLTKFGFDPVMVSKVGKDEFGNELYEIIKSKKIESSWIQRDEKYPTGVVKVKVSPSGDAMYDIVFPSAWDYIDYPESISENDFILIFGSLASRNKHSKKTLMKLLEKSEITLFDVNLRAPHYSKSLVQELLSKSTIVKLNEDEIIEIGAWFGVENQRIKSICKMLTKHYELDQIIVTLGSKGAMVYHDGQIHQHGGFEVKVADTVGSGDSFLAAYLAYLLRGHTIEESVDMACATGAFVATRNGAMPKYRESDLEGIRRSK